MNKVSLVIPGKNVELFLDRCLASAVNMLETERISEIIYVDNDSTDRSLEIAMRYHVKSLVCKLKGPSATRNIGWKAAVHPYIWFVDSDCELNQRALDILLETMEKQNADAVCGGYLNGTSNSLLAELIQNEFEYRYSKMKGIVSYATSCNLLCKRNLLEDLSGFRENILSVEDGDFVFRALNSNKKICFNSSSRLSHLHANDLKSYLKKQLIHAYWAVDLYSKNPGKALGHSYSSLIDHVQPVLVFLFLLFAPFFLSLALFFLFLFLLAQLPIVLFIYSDISLQNAVYFLILSFFRTVARVCGIFLAIKDKLIEWMQF